MNRNIFAATLALVLGMSISTYAYQSCTVTHTVGTITTGWCTNGVFNWANCLDDVPNNDGACHSGQPPATSNDSYCADQNTLPYYSRIPSNPYHPCPAGSGTGNTIGCTQGGQIGLADQPYVIGCR